MVHPVRSVNLGLLMKPRGRRDRLMVRASDSGYLEMFGFEPWRGSFVLCSWARHFSLTVPLYTQEYINNMFLGTSILLS